MRHQLLALLSVAHTARYTAPVEDDFRSNYEKLDLQLDRTKRFMDSIPTIVCLCGSTRFYPHFQQANYRFTMEGKIVLSVGFYRPSPESEAELTRYQHHGENIGCTPEQKIALDELHKRKIDLCDEVFVLNVGGYIGQSTASEIDYATNTGKLVRYLEERS